MNQSPDSFLSRRRFALTVAAAAATAHRGVRHIRVPTTTLSQSDSGVGVKNGINAFGKKNFVGTFAPPFAVLNDRRFLESLGRRGGRGQPSQGVRLFACQIHRNRVNGVTSLWTAHSFEVNASGNASSSGNRNGSRWYQIDNLGTTPSLTQSGTLLRTWRAPCQSISSSTSWPLASLASTCSRPVP
jgi:hypothetical protein